MSGVWFKPPQSWLPMLHCGVYLRDGCGVDSEWPGEACVTTKMEVLQNSVPPLLRLHLAPPRPHLSVQTGRCFNLDSICMYEESGADKGMTCSQHRIAE
eukprot:755696-Hanusia_phi.AAC.4